MAEDNLKSIIDKVTDAVDDAISNSDFSDLSSQIGDLMSDVVEVARSFGEAAANRGYESKGQAAARREAARREAIKNARQYELKKQAEEKEAREKKADQYFMRPEDASGSKIKAVLGTVGAVIFGITTAVVGVVGAAIGGVVGSVMAPIAVFAGLLTAAGIALSVSGKRTAAKRTKFKAYRDLLLPKLYSDVKDLAIEMNLPEKEVIRDLEAFSKEGKFRQGHFDAEKKCFIASDELYGQYQRNRQMDERRQAEEAAERQKEEQYSAAVREILSKGNECIRMIHDANANIPDVEVTDKLNRMESVVRKIFDEVRERPELADKLSMFMNYYLPTTAKLVNAYEEMDRQSVQGDNIRKAKREIADSLGTINDAFEKLFDSFFLQQTEDVTSDINVMKMMMKQEGLSEDDLSAMRRKQDAQMAQAAVSSGSSQSAYASADAYQVQAEEQ